MQELVAQSMQVPVSGSVFVQGPWHILPEQDPVHALMTEMPTKYKQINLFIFIIKNIFMFY